MLPQFFINRPVFAWVVAIAIILGGLTAIPMMPIARYPSVAPPSVTITATYPGATPRTMNDSVISLIEREISSVKNMLYFESSADTSGTATITVTFRSGTSPELGQVDVQNRLKTIEARLPQAVRQAGLSVESSVTGFLAVISLTSRNGAYDSTALGDYMARNVVEEIKRIPGVGKVQNFSSEQAMRIWVDPAKLTAYGLSIGDVTDAVSTQNAQIAPGSLSGEPTVSAQRVTVPLAADGQLHTPDDFRQIVLKSNVDGSAVTIGDVARVSLGAQSYAMTSRINGRPSAAIAVQMSPGGNAVETARGIDERLKILSRTMPDGMEASVPFNTAPFVSISIEKVIHTLIEAMVLVFAVMYLFLQKFRYTLIPAIVAPVALLGTFFVMMLSGFSINVLTMFGMVLAIGIIVDDAIVVVETVERIMAVGGLGPKDAAREAMQEITTAIIGITLVLSAVFIPMALASGAVGAIYKQFTMSMAVSILFSAFLALTLTPALCATMLKPVEENEKKGKFFTWFNSKFDRMVSRYETLLRRVLQNTGWAMVGYGTVVIALVVATGHLSSAFLPEEDQGYFLTTFQMPSDATAQRTSDAVAALEKHTASRSGIDRSMSILGYGFSGSGANSAMVYTMMKDWSNRQGATIQDEMNRTNVALARDVHEGTIMTLLPPSIDELGNSSGFTLRLQDRGNHNYADLRAALGRLLELASKSPLLQGVYPDGLPPGPGIKLRIDRKKAAALGLSFASINTTLTAALGSVYVNDFPNKGRTQQVIVQAETLSRAQIGDVLKLTLRNNSGGMVHLREVVTPVWEEEPLQIVRYNGYPSLRISGSAALGVSSGAAMAEMDHLAQSLPKGFTTEWTGQSLQERQSASQAPKVLAFSMLVIFLVLAALYESWAIPISVIMVIPLGLIGAVCAVLLRGLPSDVFFKVGMVTIIGLSAKNAILIVEFAKQYRDEGKELADAAISAATTRLRPIIMTSLAFTLGIVPLMIAHGASAETQHAIGTGVFGGMITATILAIFLVPVFFVVVLRLSDRIGSLGKKTQNITSPAGEA